MRSASISHYADMASRAWQEAAQEQTRPSVLYRPTLSLDGNKWCALLGDDLQVGLAAFGDSPAEAMRAFDAAWFKRIGETK